MTISQCLFFKYGEVNFFDEFGIINCKVDSSGLFNETFLSTRTIKEQQIRGHAPYFQGIERQNLSFSLTFAFNDSWSKDKLRDLSRMLDSDYYKPMVFYNSLIPTGDETIYFAMMESASQIIHDGNKNGYITLQVKTNAPYGFSPVYLTPNTTIYEYFFSPWQPTPIPINIPFINDGDVSIKPIIIVKTFIRDFSIINLNNAGQKLKFTGLTPNETIEICCENETIISDISDITYRFNNMSQDSTFLEMVRGVNTLQCLGNFELQIKYEMKYLT